MTNITPTYIDFQPSTNFTIDDGLNDVKLYGS